MRVSELNVYPLKSGRGIALSGADIAATGIPGDRIAMLAEPSGRFITQRETPGIARITATPANGGLQLSFAGSDETLHAAPTGARLDVDVWKTIVSASVADDAINAALSRWLERDVLLTFFDGQSQRIASPEWAGDGTPVTFADGYQILVTTTASLKALNENMQANGEEPVGMDRFRPNIVIDHDEPWAEDRWTSIRIGSVTLDLVKPCARCIMTTQDQLTGSREGASPMKAMGRLRMSADRRVPGPLFGWNAVPRSTGRIETGAAVEIVEGRPEGWAIKKR